MRDDLLHATAAVDWAVAQIETITRRISVWRRSGPYLAITKPDSHPGKEIIKVRERKPIPRDRGAHARQRDHRSATYG